MEPAFSVVSGNEQVGAPGVELADPLVVRAEDSRGRPLRGQIINFRVVSGGGTVFAGAAITDQQGTARERWTLGSEGVQRVEARAVDPATGAPLIFGVFTATFLDGEAPLVQHAAALPNPALTTDVVQLTAQANDLGTGGSSIASAEFQVDGGSFTAMAAADGTFDESDELVIGHLQAPSVGVHEICIRATDTAANLSGTACVTLTVTEPIATDFTGLWAHEQIDYVCGAPDLPLVNVSFSSLGVTHTDLLITLTSVGSDKPGVMFGQPPFDGAFTVNSAYSGGEFYEIVGSFDSANTMTAVLTIEFVGEPAGTDCVNQTFAINAIRM
ncbi:MAG: hypothetical protein WEG36_00050 [Gemmatimonadota bacterium]